MLQRMQVKALQIWCYFHYQIFPMFKNHLHIKLPAKQISSSLFFFLSFPLTKYLPPSPSPPSLTTKIIYNFHQKSQLEKSLFVDNKSIDTALFQQLSKKSTIIQTIHSFHLYLYPFPLHPNKTTNKTQVHKTSILSSPPSRKWRKSHECLYKEGMEYWLFFF